jgi:hypothetical protein
LAAAFLRNAPFLLSTFLCDSVSLVFGFFIAAVAMPSTGASMAGMEAARGVSAVVT